MDFKIPKNKGGGGWRMNIITIMVVWDDSGTVQYDKKIKDFLIQH